MKLSVSKEKLLEGLQTVQNVVSTRTTLPILSNVLAPSRGRPCSASPPPTSMSACAAASRPASRSPAPTTLPARRLFTIVRELPTSEIHIEVDSKNVASIRSGPSFFKILGLPEEEFPPLPKFEEAKVFTLRQKDLKDGLKKTAYAISTDETRYVLNGILFSLQGQQADPRGDGWTPPRAGGYRAGVSAQPGSGHHRAHQGRHRTRPPGCRGRRRQDSASAKTRSRSKWTGRCWCRN